MPIDPPVTLIDAPVDILVMPGVGPASMPFWYYAQLQKQASPLTKPSHIVDL